MTTTTTTTTMDTNQDNGDEDFEDSPVRPITHPRTTPLTRHPNTPPPPQPKR